MDNSSWLLGNGVNINFWNDNWCGTSLVEQLNIPAHTRPMLTSSVSDYIQNGLWEIPSTLTAMFSNLRSIVSQVTIPMFHTDDKLIWRHTDSGELELKEAYLFKMQQYQELHWAKLIWNPAIPPSRSFMAWRLMHEKMPTDENLILRGCALPSMCNRSVESSFHLFFACSYAIKLWSWLAGCLDLTLQFTTMEDMWTLCDLNWSPQSKVTITAALINLLHTIWTVRNEARFNDNHISWRSAISMIISSTCLAGNSTCKPSSKSLRDFTFLKKFRISIHQPKVPILREVCWTPPLMSWLKCNIDGASNGNPGIAACGGIFRNHDAEFIYGFAEPLGITSSFVAEISGAMRAIEIAFHKKWTHLWIESDSSSVVAAFKNPDKQVAYGLRNRWKNALAMVGQMNCVITHIYREGNQVADLFANFGLSIPDLVFWTEIPLFIKEPFEKNKLGIPSFRLCSS
jgi:ribonuclease HI